MRDNDLRGAIIVGHPAGGIFLQVIAAAEPERVRGMVFLAAVVPERGRDILHRQPLPARLMSPLLLTLPRADSRGIVPNRRLARRVLCDTLQRTECESLVGRLTPEPAALLRDPIDWQADRVRARHLHRHHQGPSHHARRPNRDGG